MDRFIDICEVSGRELQRYLDMGYVVFETTKKVYEYGEQSLIYHVGYPLVSHHKELKGIIELYEQYGLKEELMKRIAESIGENLEDYTIYADGKKVKNELVDALEKYERVVNGKVNISYYKKRTSAEIAEQYDDFF